ncbi:MAG TPA: sulfotransferase [Trebonia sp.]|jgi:hypothetical protein|nr:sulfotransferase [Trebonia sp.]
MGDKSGADALHPVLFFSHGFVGGRVLDALLERDPSFVCTFGTGVLAACEQAAQVWRNIENNPTGMSALASTSVRVLVNTMLTSIRARTGAGRWCEFISADPSVAETFLSLFPDTKCICLHRSCPDSVHLGFNANPWGLAGNSFSTFNAKYPSSQLSALSAWWAARTRTLLDFEAAHPGVSLRVHYEDLVSDPLAEERRILDFIGVDNQLSALVNESDSAVEIVKAGKPGCGAGFPAGQLPQQLLSDINELQARLGYPRLRTLSKSLATLF